MSEQEIKNLFDRLKAENQAKMPGYEELLARQQPAVAPKGRSLQFPRWWIAAAAAALIAVSTAWWIWGPANHAADEYQLAEQQEEVDNFETTQNLDDIGQWQWTENAQIYDQNEPSPNGIKVELPKEVKKVIAESPELSEELYVHGAIADWQSPTHGLMPF